MSIWIDASCILIVFFALSILASYRIAGMIRILSVQSFVLSLVPLFIHTHDLSGRELILSLATMVLKAALLPYILFWTIRHVSIRSEIRPIISLGQSIVGGALLIAGAFWVSLSLTLPDTPAGSDLVLPCSLATMLMGFMTIVTRTKAVTQVIGYLVMENGIFLFALSLFDTMPTLIEMGILMDIFAAVFIMAIVVNHINEELERVPAPADRAEAGGGV